MKRGTVRTLGFSTEAAAGAAAVTLSPGVRLQVSPTILSEESRGTAPALAASPLTAALGFPVRERG
jgi:hypothetical protein